MECLNFYFLVICCRMTQLILGQLSDGLQTELMELNFGLTATTIEHFLMKGTTLFMVYVLFNLYHPFLTLQVRLFDITCFISHVLGGNRGFSKVIWTVVEHDTGEFPFIKFYYHSFDGEQGKVLIIINGPHL